MGEEPLCAGNGETGKRCCHSQRRLVEARFGAKGNQTSLLITGFPWCQCPDWALQLLLPDLPALVPWCQSVACAVSRTPRFGIWLPCSETQTSLGDSGAPRGWGQGSQVGGCGCCPGERQGGNEGRHVHPLSQPTLHLCPDVRLPWKCAGCAFGQEETPFRVSRQLRCQGSCSLVPELCELETSSKANPHSPCICFIERRN